MSPMWGIGDMSPRGPCALGAGDARLWHVARARGSRPPKPGVSGGLNNWRLLQREASHALRVSHPGSLSGRGTKAVRASEHHGITPLP